MCHQIVITFVRLITWQCLLATISSDDSLDLQFTKWPGVVGGYPFRTAILEWRFNLPVSRTWKGQLLMEGDPSKLVFGWSTSSTGDILVRYGQGYDNRKVLYDIRLGLKTIKFAINNLHPEDAKYNYALNIVLDERHHFINRQAWLILFKHPSPPKVTPHVGAEVVSLTCNSVSTSTMPDNIPTELQPRIYFTWEVDENFIRHAGTFRIGGHNNNTIYLSNLRATDEHSVYKCFAHETGSVYRSRNSATLNIHSNPTLTHIIPHGVINKIAGDSLTLICSSICHPPCHYTWMKGDNKLHVGDKLAISSLTNEDGGLYKCMANNGVPPVGYAEVYVNINYPPKLTITRTPSGDIVAGSQLILDCAVDSLPKTNTITWKNASASGLPPLGCTEKTDTHCSLTLNNVNLFHSGTYECRADNGVSGSPSTSQETVTVYGPPRWYKTEPAELSLEVGRSEEAVFKVWIVSRPLPRADQWHWSFSGSASTMPEQISLSVSGNLAVLTIANATKNHEGIYSLWTRNSYGGWLEGDLRFTLTLIHVNISSWPDAIKCYENESATLRWTVNQAVGRNWQVKLYRESDRPELVCAWKISASGDIQKTYGQRYNADKVTMDVALGSRTIQFTINDLGRDDAKYSYSLTVDIADKYTLTNRRAWLVMYAMPKMPKVVVHYQHGVVHFRCQTNSTTVLPANTPAKYKPIIQYRWDIDKNFLRHGGSYRVFGPNNNMLDVARLRPSDDNSVYVCHAREPGSRYEVTDRAILRLVTPAKLTHIVPSGNIIRVVSDSLSLFCFATCNPACNYRWVKSGKTIGVGDRFNISSIKRADDGIYTCVSENSIPSNDSYNVTLIVNYPPEVTITRTTSGELVEGSEVTLNCSVDGKPTPTSVSWKNITAPGLPSLGCTHKDDGHCSLTLAHIDILHSGTYQCTADNGVRGSPVTAVETITVYGAARWYRLDPASLALQVRIGETAKLRVWVVARPLPTQSDWRWKFTGDKQPERVSLAVSGDMAVLSIRDVSQADAGIYSMWTSNRYGGWNEDDLRFNLTVSYLRITEWPGVVFGYEKETIVLEWTLSSPVDGTWKGEVYLESAIPELICGWSVSGSGELRRTCADGYDGGKINIDVAIGSRKVRLTIHDLRPEYAQYNYALKIVVDDKYTVTSREAWIVLYGNPTEPNLTVQANNSLINLSCSSRSTTVMPDNMPRDLRPVFQYYWEIDKTFREHGGRYAVGGLNNHTLTLTGWHPNNDKTVYKCYAQESGSRYMRGVDHILSRPQGTHITPSDVITVTENEYLTMTCSATCYPPCQYKWLKDGELLAKGNKLVIQSVRIDQAGVYQCISDNSLPPEGSSKVTINVNYAPRLTITRVPSGYLMEGSEVTLICAVDSKPKPTSITWKNITLPDLAPLGCTYKNDTHCSLTLRGLNLFHSGRYQCVVDNGIKDTTVTGETTIPINGPVRWIKVDPANFIRAARIGDSAMFMVWIKGRPLPKLNQWHWSFIPSYLPDGDITDAIKHKYTC